MRFDSRKKSFTKSVIWRILGVIVLATIVYFYTREWIVVGLVSIIHHATFLAVFYLHERVWFKIKNIIGRKRRIIKALVYEVILGMGIGGAIVFLVTGQWSDVTRITITYTIVKIVMYYFYERIWTRDRKIVYTYACGDVVHVGHLKYFKTAQRYGYLIVGVLTKKAIMEKKPEPTISFNERLEVIKELKCVDEVIPQDTYSPLENVKKIKPDILIESDSHKEMPANEFVESYGGKVIIVPYYKSQSSSEIKKKIHESFK